MSWLISNAMMQDYGKSPSLPERAGAFSEVTYSAGEPSAPLNVMPTAHKFWRRGKTIESSDLSLFGLTCAVLTEDDGEAVLTSFLRDFPVRTSAPLARVQESTASRQGSTAKSPGLLAKWSPLSCGWKTAQCSLLADSDESSVTWPRSGSMRNGECWERPMLASITTGSASGFSHPTPSGVNGGRNNTMGRIDEWGGSSNRFRGTVIGSLCLPPLEEMVMGWPIGWTELTPYETARFHEWSSRHGDNLQHESRRAA